MAKRYHREFRDDAVSVARRREAPLTGIAHHFGVAEATLSAWSMQADDKDAVRPDQIESDAADR
jgi:transposase-like protein